MTSHAGRFDEILLLEDNKSTAERRESADRATPGSRPAITVRLHRINGMHSGVIGGRNYEADEIRSRRSARLDMVLDLLSDAPSAGAKTVVVAGTSFGSSKPFLAALRDLELSFVVEIRPSECVTPIIRGGAGRQAAELLERGTWSAVTVWTPDGTAVSYRAARLGAVDLPGGTGNLFAAQIGGISGVHKGTIIGISSFNGPTAEFVQLIAHGRWIRVAARRAKREAEPASGGKPSGTASTIRGRANIAVARRQDARVRSSEEDTSGCGPDVKGSLREAAATLNVVELFAGAGGMGLGFLLAGKASGGYRIVYSGEANPIFVETLRENHRFYDGSVAATGSERTPPAVAAADLRDSKALDEVDATARERGGAHVVIGGPPCQGFSTANRNSWSRKNPNNELIEVFVQYIERLRPLAFLMENVQGILWTQDALAATSVVDVVERRLDAAGYKLFPRLVDAAWYGVPQNRARFFLMGLHQDLGYVEEDFGDQGPFPAPTHGRRLHRVVTVRDAIADLPPIGNGCLVESSAYSDPSKDMDGNAFLRYVREGSEQGVIFDHVTSRHADYVIDRYRRIPAGGNWESIRESLTNYTNVSRTHSNIYRRLRWDEPSITIGHYRKSMLIHPSQHRGLSLREATRLQSFPDWFRFAGTVDGTPGGLVHKQQQLANAVCPLVTKAIAEYMLAL